MAHTTNFSGKHVIITGGARGIGLEIAIQFMQEGARVAILDVNETSLQKAEEHLVSISKSFSTHNVDVSDQKAVEKAVEAVEMIQPIDILINNAGIANETPFLKITADEWRRIIDINLSGMFYVGQSVCRRMAERKKGVVVNMASKNGLDGEFGYAHYNSSKGGVVMLTKSMALELAHLGIRVNAVCPGYIQTPMSMEIDSPEFTDKFVERYIPLNRPGNVKETASVFLFLASDAASFITGQTIVVDGGQLAGQKPFTGLLNS
jgi:3-oxoacyl-[acyl-carrier protein] reductase